jgi:hypothetical protein
VISHPIYQHFSSIEHEADLQRFDSELHFIDSGSLGKTGGQVRCNLWQTGESKDIDGEGRKGAWKCRCKGRRLFRDKKLHRYVQKAYSQVGILRNDNSMRFELYEQLCQSSNGVNGLHVP